MQNILKALLINKSSSPTLPDGVNEATAARHLFEGEELGGVFLPPHRGGSRRGFCGGLLPLLRGGLGWGFLLSLNIAFANPDKPVTKPEVDSLKRAEERLWYVDGPITKKKADPQTQRAYKAPRTTTKVEEPSSGWAAIGTVFQVLIWVILGAAVLGAIYVIIKNLKDFKFKPKSNIKVSTNTIIEELEGQELGSVDFDVYIDKAIKEKNYRLATRYYYLWVMKTLNEANLIVFNIDKTNQDYIRELSKKTAFAREKLTNFKQCTNYYEYLWFGNFNVSETTFVSIENTFKDFINKRP